MKWFPCRETDQQQDSLAWKVGNMKVKHWATKPAACTNCCPAPPAMSVCGWFMCCAGWCGKLARWCARLQSYPDKTESNREELKPPLLKCVCYEEWGLEASEILKMHHLVWLRAGRRAHPNSLLYHASNGTGPLSGGEQHFAGWVTSWSVLACGSGGRERPDPFLAHLRGAQRSTQWRQPALCVLCSLRCTASAKLSPPLLCCAARADQHPVRVWRLIRNASEEM